ncbi:hypothetical protein MACJ_002226 [Theileria orientalis]|uniref:Elongation factor P C-terminal domain-containing protein n=1 Tax=Theileria orientalis TaxID=68886 RepID=A0A976QSI6_THEOR|nr:hypothetical protein MACJ_002226 [Theileria orientalis]
MKTQPRNLEYSKRSSYVRPLNYYEQRVILHKILYDKNSELIKDLISKASPEELCPRRPKPREDRRIVATDEELIRSVSQDEGVETVEDTGYEEPTQINHVRAGHYVLHKNQVYTVSTTQHIAQARSKGHYKLKMKLLHTTKEMSFSFPDGCKMTVLTPRKVSCEYSHFNEDTNCYVFKSEVSDISVPRGINIASLKYLKPRLKVTISRWRDKILGVFVPFHIEYRVVQLNTGNYAATLDNGLVVLVPTYIKVNDHIEITTKACEFLRRTKIS